MPSVPRKATQFHAVQNRADYATRLPVQNNIKSNKTWFAMQNDMVPNPAPSKEAIYQEISKMRPKRALTRRIVVASQTGDLKTLRKILWGNRRVSVNRMYRKSKKSAALTPLCWAALNGHVGIVECLLDGVAEDPEQIELRLLEELSMVLRGEKAPVEQPSLTKGCAWCHVHQEMIECHVPHNLYFWGHETFPVTSLASYARGGRQDRPLLVGDRSKA